jgi:hypothetical protein
MRLVHDPDQELLDRVLRAAHRVEAPEIEEQEARERAERATARAAAFERRRRAVVATFATAVAAAVVLALTGALVPTRAPEPHARSAPPDVPDVLRPDVPSDARLPSGDRLVVASGTRYEVESTGRDRRIRLDRGEVRFEVAHVDGGSFTVLAGGVAVRVRGTVFSVRADRGVTVEVFEGSVEVRRGDARFVLTGGDRWFSEDVAIGDAPREREHAEPPRDTPRTEADPRRPARTHDVRDSTSQEGTAPSREAAEDAFTTDDDRLREARELLRARDFVGALEVCGGREEADWLLLRADALRGLGRSRDAAEAYDAAVLRLSDARRASAGYAAARLWSESSDGADAALASLRTGHATRPGSAIEERARVLEIELLLRVGGDPRAQIEEYVRRFPDTSTARELRRRLGTSP